MSDFRNVLIVSKNQYKRFKKEGYIKKGDIFHDGRRVLITQKMPGITFLDALEDLREAWLNFLKPFVIPILDFILKLLDRRKK